MRIDQDQNTHPRLLRKSSLGGGSTDNEIKLEKKTGNMKGSRFVAPTQLDDDQKSQFSKALKKKKIGDQMGREIFIAAVEYQMSAFASQLKCCVEPESQSETTAADAAGRKALRAIVENARHFSGLLRALPDETQERVTEMLAREAGLWRGYDGRYLCELGLEIDRLERACIAAGGEPEPPEPEPEPEPDSDPRASTELVAKLAGIFSECFEMEPTAAENGDFRNSLVILSEVTGLIIEHSPEFLAQVLAKQPIKHKGG